MQLSYLVLGWTAWLTCRAKQIYKPQSVTENQFITTIKQNTGSQILCIEECKRYESCLAVRYSAETGACSMGTVETANSGGELTTAWMTDCKICVEKILEHECSCLLLDGRLVLLKGYTEKDGVYFKYRFKSSSAPTYAAALAICQADGGQFPMYKTPEDLQLVRSVVSRQHWIGMYEYFRKMIKIPHAET